jgi:hypothetical protein
LWEVIKPNTLWRLNQFKLRSRSIVGMPGHWPCYN